MEVTNEKLIERLLEFLAMWESSQIMSVESVALAKYVVGAHRLLSSGLDRPAERGPPHYSEALDEDCLRSRKLQAALQKFALEGSTLPISEANWLWLTIRKLDDLLDQ